MWADRHFVAMSFSTALAQVTNQFFTGVELGAGGLIAIKIADEADA